jgi:hypothetical protein
LNIFCQNGSKKSKYCVQTIHKSGKSCKNHKKNITRFCQKLLGFPENRSQIPFPQKPRSPKTRTRSPRLLVLPLAAGTTGPAGLPKIFDNDGSLSLAVGNILSSPPCARLRFQAAPSSSSSPPSSSPKSSPLTPPSSSHESSPPPPRQALIPISGFCVCSYFHPFIAEINRFIDKIDPINQFLFKQISKLNYGMIFEQFCQIP